MDTQKRDKLKELRHVANALLQSMEASVRAGPDNVWKYTSYWHFIRKYNQLIDEVAAETPIETVVDKYNLENVPRSGDTLAMQQKEYFDSVHAKLSILSAYLESKLGLKEDEISNLRNFLQANLRKAVFQLPEKETEIQDRVEQLLIGRGLTRGIDYDRETGRVKVSIKEVIPDFVFPRLGLALEVKLSKDKEKAKSIVDEINADITAYSKKYSSLLFVVYDVAAIRDEDEFKRGLDNADNIAVIVVKH